MSDVEPRSRLTRESTGTGPYPEFSSAVFVRIESSGQLIEGVFLVIVHDTIMPHVVSAD
jgi:hypothetical protein